MQKVRERAPGAWASTKTQSKKGFDKAWGWLDKLGAPINRFSNKIGSEAFWPTTLDKESDKAARILRSFCKDGFYTDAEQPSESASSEKVNGNDGDQNNGLDNSASSKTPEVEGPKGKQRVLKKIPQKVIENAVGLAIFTTMRTGLWLSGAGGSGVLVARKEDGSWSPPSGIMLHTAGLGFLVGVDIYDCVVVINNRKALEAFTAVRATLGGEISAVAGPVGVGGVLENDGKWKQANRPVFTYLKSRGFYAGVQVDGTIVIERTDENARFYGEEVRVADILAGKVRRPPPELKTLMETLKAAEGRSDVDSALLEELDELPPPGDVDLEAPMNGKIFGIPEVDDPDPYGVHALELQGLEIHEAGTGSRPSGEHFNYNPSPSSPVFGILSRSSMDADGTRSHRQSLLATEGRPRRSTDASTQTGEEPAPQSSPLSPLSDSNYRLDKDTTGSGDRNSPSGTHSITRSPEEEHNVYAPASWDARSGTPEDNVWLQDGSDVSTKNAVRGPPPPLPPRQQPSQLEFEEVDLKGATTTPA